MSAGRIAGWQARWADREKRFGVLVDILSAYLGVSRLAAARALLEVLAEFVEDVRLLPVTAELVALLIDDGLEAVDAVVLAEAERRLDVLDVVAGAAIRLLGVNDLLLAEALLACQAAGEGGL